MKSLKLHTLASMLAVIAACAVASPPVLAAGASQGAPHAHGGAAPAGLALDHGRKWSTDAPLRGGMARIRTLVEPQLGAAHAGKLQPAQATALADRIETEIGGIVANCKLEPQADAMLHLVIGEIGAGTEAMKGRTPAVRPGQGLVLVAAALNSYGEHFEHPGFRPIHVGH
ncbi:hypothetical protein ACFPOE_05445 [Caenimonas terrae]|uniref:DnrO protein n=1 Tax=Caenimonas terrae TaxID=696074 RepID=A0ABW0NAM6_9BURK